VIIGDAIFAYKKENGRVAWIWQRCRKGVRMRPVISANDSFAAGEILTLFIGDDPWKLEKLVPGGSTFNAVEIADDGSAAVFEVFGGSDWDAMEARSLGRVIVRR
jgi:hypothetical protein